MPCGRPSFHSPVAWGADGWYFGRGRKRASLRPTAGLCVWLFFPKRGRPRPSLPRKGAARRPAEALPAPPRAHSGALRRTRLGFGRAPRWGPLTAAAEAGRLRSHPRRAAPEWNLPGAPANGCPRCASVPPGAEGIGRAAAGAGAQCAASARPGSSGLEEAARLRSQPWCRCCVAARRWPPAESCSAPGGSSCWSCWAFSSTSTRLCSSKMSRPQKKTLKAKGRTRSTSSTTKSVTTASSLLASTSSWGASPSAKCDSTSGRNTWSAKDSPPTPVSSWRGLWLFLPPFPVLCLIFILSCLSHGTHSSL